ncbi:acyl-CoA transferase [Rubellimicrobium aerolatum]|uniref:Acyl-CoA transferase n=1 Tax=Rubellimicrobium aerolatum TaxID=490979 RepID=A0ABW0SEZ9_9RHOB|nr:acyl-CoA transferase [Rubellimicrobium aerolatum]MBP1806463.1 hypothetical protein [Rubellimicrobium aerolatum]
MPSRLEEIMQVLEARLTAWTGAAVRRGEVLPVRVPPNGLIILREGDPGTPDVTLCPLTYHYEHEAQAEIFTDVGADRHFVFDALKLALGQALGADRTLGGLCDWLEAGAPQIEDLPVTEGGAPLKAAVVPIRLHFATPDPLS